MENKPTFSELQFLMSKYVEVWVKLNTGVKICLDRVISKDGLLFGGTYFPCIDTARVHPIKYESIQELAETKRPRKESGNG